MVTVLVMGSMTPVMVRAAGLVAGGPGRCSTWPSWSPAWSCGSRCSGAYPGIPRPKPVVRFGYLVAQAVVPAFLSFIYIFSRRPLYPEFARSHAAIGLRPLNDQQIAGFVSKLTMLFVLLTWGPWSWPGRRGPTTRSTTGETLVWADVERQFERVDRQSARAWPAGRAAGRPDRHPAVRSGARLGRGAGGRRSPTHRRTMTGRIHPDRSDHSRAEPTRTARHRNGDSRRVCTAPRSSAP